MSVPWRTCLVVAALAIPGVLVGRLFIGFPLLPPSGREIVVRLTNLPVPLFAHAEDAVDECSGFFCMDYYARGLVRLDPQSCSEAVALVSNRGWSPLPMPPEADPLQSSGTPSVPDEGFFRLDRRDAEETQEFAWIDTSNCRVYAELVLW